MNRIFINVIIIFFLNSQELTIHSVEEGTIIEKIENTLISDVLDLLSKRNGKKLKYEVRQHKTFADLMVFFAKGNSDIDLHLAINSITITKAREAFLDFSHPYVPTREVLICKMHRGDNLNHLISNSMVGYNTGTIQDISVKKLQEKFKFNAIGYSLHAVKEDDLLQGKLDFMIGDNINVWNDNRMHIVEELEYQSGEGFGIAYFKGSKLKKEIDPILKYYLRSAKFRKLTAQHFGDDISDYFARVLFTTK
jgi:ABC-type amino acid transport substrate-binding protein